MMIIGSTLLSLFLPAATARRFALLGTILAAVLALGALWGAWQAFDWWNDRQAVKEADARREAAAAKHRETAAEERVEDALRNTRNEEELHDAIDRATTGAPPGELSPAARALACERLRRIGRVPPACRPAGGDGDEAGPD